MTTTTNTNPARYVCPRRARITRALYPHRIASLDTIRHELAQGLSDTPETSKTSITSTTPVTTPTRRRVLVRIGDPQDKYIKSSHPETMRATAQYYNIWWYGALGSMTPTFIAGFLTRLMLIIRRFLHRTFLV